MWQKNEFDRAFPGDDDESPKAKKARTVADIFQHIREFGEFLKGITTLEAPIRTDEAQILLYLQATGCEEALGLGATAQLERAEAAINELLEAQAGPLRQGSRGGSAGGAHAGLLGADGFGVAGCDGAMGWGASLVRRR